MNSILKKNPSTGVIPFGAVNRNLEDLDHLQLFKMAHSALPVMGLQKLFEYSPTDICPCCGNEQETATDMLKYHLLNTESWKEELQDGGDTLTYL